LRACEDKGPGKHFFSYQRPLAAAEK